MAGREAFCELDWDTMEHSFHRRRQHKALIIGKKIKKSIGSVTDPRASLHFHPPICRVISRAIARASAPC